VRAAVSGREVRDNIEVGVQVTLRLHHISTFTEMDDEKTFLLKMYQGTGMGVHISSLYRSIPKQNRVHVVPKRFGGQTVVICGRVTQAGDGQDQEDKISTGAARSKCVAQWSVAGFLETAHTATGSMR
jgi:hypothetical protein